METVELKVEGMHCGGCESTLARVLGMVDGVAATEASWEQGRVVVTFDPARADLARIRGAIEGAGYDLAV